MNDIRKTIGWADLSWNPIKGLCPVGCWYCYARKIYKRFGLDEKPWLDVFELNDMAGTKRTGKRVFVCSTFDLFHPVVDSLDGITGCLNGKLLQGKARDLIFDVIERRPDLTFIILTKMPDRIDRPMPDNVWLGVSIEGEGKGRRVDELMKHEARVRFVSIEPFTGFVPMIDLDLSWVIVGRLTGHGHKNDPGWNELFSISQQCKEAKIPLFMKSNLADLWPGELIQEWPAEVLAK